MTFTAFLGILGGVFKFWDQVTWLVQTLQKTPEQQHAELIAKIKKEADDYAKKGSRPVWGP